MAGNTGQERQRECASHSTMQRDMGQWVTGVSGLVCVCVCVRCVLLTCQPVCLSALSLSSCSVTASVVTELVQPHGGQPCKEHKRPI